MRMHSNKWDKNKQLVRLDQSEASIVVDTEG